MNVPLLALLLLASAAAMRAQARHFTSPQQLDTKEAPSQTVGTSPLAQAVGRYQFSDGGQRGTARAGISKLELRRDGQAACVCPARSPQLALVLAECNAQALGPAFAGNYLGPATTVFTPKVTNLPDHSAAPPGGPAPWTVALPFDQPWNYPGLNDLLWELQIDFNPNFLDGYSLDAVQSQTPGLGWFVYAGGSGCQTLNGRFDIFASEPRADAAGLVTLGLHAQRGPTAVPAVLLLGGSDPNLQGPLCAPLRTSGEIALPCATDFSGAIASAASQFKVTFPFTAPLVAHAQFVALDYLQAPLPLALSDAVRLGVVEHAAFPVSVLFATTSTAAPFGVRTALGYPVARFTYP